MTIRPGADELEELDAAERDPLFEKAVDIMIETGRGSVSLLQRRLAIGYSRASRLVDQMAMAGILGDHKGSVAREVLITQDEWEEMKRLEQEQEADGTLFARNGKPPSENDSSADDDDDVAVVETLVDDDTHTKADADDDSDEDDEEYEYEYVDEDDDGDEDGEYEYEYEYVDEDEDETEHSGGKR
jgi:DNA segregation ATPase FtsK/SpoIIIE, S-DNA-T family